MDLKGIRVNAVKKYILPLLVAVVAVLSACGNGDKVAEADQKAGKTAEAPVKQHEAIADSTETFSVREAARSATLTAFTRARNTMTLVSEVSARVDRVMADVGDEIGKDGVFAVLDSTFIRLDLEANRADQARLKSDVDYYGKEKGRYDDLVKSRTAAQSTLDSHVRDHASALQQLRALQIEERRLQEKLRRHSLKGPAGWRVVERMVEPGEWLNVGQEVATLGRYDVLLVPFALGSEEYVALKQMGESIPLKLPDLGKTVRAVVERVSPGFDPETRKLNVDLQISEGDFEFRGGVRTELDLALPDPGG